MKTEIPELKRCCFCIPLRQGLLTFGYVRLIISLLFITLASFDVYNILNVNHRFLYYWMEELIMASLAIVIMLVDAAFTIVFLVGGHQKSAKLLRVFYIYSIVMLCLTFLCMILFIVLKVIGYAYYEEKHIFVYSTLAIFGDAFGLIVYIGFEVYFIILIRSEVNKLSNSYNFRFSNNMAEQCTLEVGSEVVPTA